MDHRFDTLAKALSGNLSRRQAFWRLGGGLITAFLASVGIARADQRDCAAACAHCCTTALPPPPPGTPAGPAISECITSCLHGEGPCGGFPGTC